MEHGGEWVVKVVQKTLPFLVLGRLAEAHLMVFEGGPTHQQHLVLRAFHAVTELVSQVAGHGGNDGLRLGKSLFKGCVLPRTDSEMSDF